MTIAADSMAGAMTGYRGSRLERAGLVQHHALLHQSYKSSLNLRDKLAALH